MPSGCRPECVRRAPARVGLVAAIAVLAAMPAGATELDWLAYSGRWGVGKSGETTELGLEARRPLGEDGFNLMAGLAGTADEALWVYAGAALAWEVNDNWALRPGFAISVFDEGEGKDLGGAIEFRSSLELAYRLRTNLGVGLMVYHLSNAGLYDLNPGANSIVLTVGFR